MKLDLTQPIRAMNKLPIVEVKSKDDKEGVPMLLKGIVLDSLLGECLGDSTVEGSKARKDRFAVAVKLTTSPGGVTSPGVDEACAPLA